MHVYNRGNNKEKIFLDEQDYRSFLLRLGLSLGFTQEELANENLLHLPYSRIRITGSKGGYKLHSFCLMPNHFHLLIEQTGNEPIAKLVLRLCTSYAKYFNAKYQRVGHVFQDQYKSVLIESDPQLMWLSSYIHMNPVKDHLVKHPKEHPWSSYKDYIGERALIMTETSFLKSIFGSNFEKETLGVKGHL